MMRDGQEDKMKSILNDVPVDFSMWVKDWVRRIDKEVGFLRHMSGVICAWIKNNTETRKEFAELAEEAGRLKPLVFFTLDDKMKHREEAIWRMIKPAHEVPFKIEE
jgi:hypothetical protein